MTIKRIGTGARMSDAVVYNGMVFLAGQVGTPGKSTKEQTVEILHQIDDLLKQAGTDKTRILSATIWLSDMADFASMNEVWEQWVVQGATPARATSQAQLAAPEYRIEIIITAALA